jgi:HAE1 family hydrophobic/amphiphilic exporter-1
VRIIGGRDYNMRVWIDPDAAASRNLTVDEIIAAIRAQNAQVAAGSVGQPPFNQGGTAFQLGIQTEGRLTTTDQFGSIIIKRAEDGRLTRLRDIARIELGAQDYGTNAYRDAFPSIGIGVTQLPGSNALKTAAAVDAEMEELAKAFPSGLIYSVPFHPTEFISASIAAVEETLFEAIILVALVVLVFLQSWRAAIIPILAIPVSLIGSFAANLTQFHAADGRGYDLIASVVMEMDSRNPQVAARLLAAFRTWRSMEPVRRAKAQAALERVAAVQGLSPDVRDIVDRSLA